jgi:hypothetical protein
VHGPTGHHDQENVGGGVEDDEPLTPRFSSSSISSHVYMTDYDRAMPQNDPNSWLQAVSGSLGAVKDATKFFVVADAATGQVLLNVSIAPAEGVQASVIVPGAHNDVFIGTRLGLLRIYV